ncbi:unnamed protein product, partial [Staurois parvus]
CSPANIVLLIISAVISILQHPLLTLGLFSTTLLPDPNLRLLLTDLGLLTDHASVVLTCLYATGPQLAHLLIDPNLLWLLSWLLPRLVPRICSCLFLADDLCMACS